MLLQKVNKMIPKDNQNTAVSVEDDFLADINTTGSLSVNGISIGNIEILHDRDWFRISLIANQSVVFDIKGSDAGANILNYPYIPGVYDVTGTMLREGRRDSSLTFTAPTAGDYFVEARCYYGGYYSDTGLYELSATSINVNDDFSASIDTTAILSVDGFSTGNLEFNGDNDWFKISLTAGQLIEFDLQGSYDSAGTLSNPHLLGIYNSKGILIKGNPDGSSSNRYSSDITFTASVTGNYYVAVSDYYSGTGTYKLSSTSLTDDFSADLGTTANLLIDRYSLGNIDYRGDKDWVKIHLIAGQVIEFSMEGVDTGAGTLTNPFIGGIYDASGNYIIRTWDDDSGIGYNANVIFTASITGDYYVEAWGITDNSGSAKGSYKLSATLLSDDFSSNISTAGSLSVGGFSTGNIEFRGDNDWFKISLIAGQQVVFDLEGTPTNEGTLTDPYLSIYGTPYGDESSGIGRNASVIYTVPTTGDYYIIASGAHAIRHSGYYYYETGTYKLSAALINTLGSAGDDTLNGGQNVDNLQGGQGDDLYIVSKGDRVIENQNEGMDTINSNFNYYNLPANVENLTLIGSSPVNGAGNDLANLIIGNGYNNRLSGNAGSDSIIGGIGNDTLVGYLGNDLLSGGDGNDTLNGGKGRDSLLGGMGSDAFLFTSKLLASHADKIIDFDVAEDNIQLENAIFSKLTLTGVLDPDYFVIGTVPQDLNDYIIYSPANGTLTYDADGTGAGSGVKIAILGVDLALSYAGFVVI